MLNFKNFQKLIYQRSIKTFESIWNFQIFYIPHWQPSSYFSKLPLKNYLKTDHSRGHTRSMFLCHVQFAHDVVNKQKVPSVLTNSLKLFSELIDVWSEVIKFILVNLNRFKVKNMVDLEIEFLINCWNSFYQLWLCGLNVTMVDVLIYFISLHQ